MARTAVAFKLRRYWSAGAGVAPGLASYSPSSGIGGHSPPQGKERPCSSKTRQSAPACSSASLWRSRSAKSITFVFGDGPTRYPQNVRVARLRFTQGVPGQPARFDSGEVYVIDPGEADGRVAVRPAVESEMLVLR